jgi:hypothetical protein
MRSLFKGINVVSISTPRVPSIATRWASASRFYDLPEAG